MKPLLAIVLLSAPAFADVTARLDPGLSLPLSAPTRDYFGLGFQAGAAIGADVLPFLEVGLRASYVFISRSASSPFAGPGSLIALGATVRGHRPAIDGKWAPWVELALQYVRTGPLDRLGLMASGGVQFPVTDSVWLGPWLGVEQVFRLEDTEAYPTRDATLLVGGVSAALVIWAPREAPRPVVLPEDPPPKADPDPDHDGVIGSNDRCPSLAEDRDGWEDDDGCPDPDDDADSVPDGDDACPRLAGTVATLGCPDRDLDGVADTDDRCPDVGGVAAESGCPAYREVTIRSGRLELAHGVDFARGSAAVPPRSAPMLDELARALADRGALCVRIEGHGDPGSKPQLAQQRADAVRVHLMAHGVPPGRLTAVGSAGPGDVELALVPCEVKAP